MTLTFRWTLRNSDQEIVPQRRPVHYIYPIRWTKLKVDRGWCHQKVTWKARSEYVSLDINSRPTRLFFLFFLFSLAIHCLRPCFLFPYYLRGAMVNRTYGAHKHLYIYLFLPTMFWSYLLWSPVIGSFFSESYFSIRSFSHFFRTIF